MTGFVSYYYFNLSNKKLSNLESKEKSCPKSPDFQFSDLQAGDTARIVGFGVCDKVYRQRLLAMGLTVGSIFCVLRKAPLGDPFQIEIRGSSLESS